MNIICFKCSEHISHTLQFFWGQFGANCVKHKKYQPVTQSFGVLDNTEVTVTCNFKILVVQEPLIVHTTWGRGEHNSHQNLEISHRFKFLTPRIKDASKLEDYRRAKVCRHSIHLG